MTGMPNVLDLIERSLMKGEVPLGAKELVGSGKQAAAALDSLVAGGLFEKRGKGYVLTLRGRQRWGEEASPERQKQVNSNAMVALLKTVQARGGKALTAAELAKHERDNIERAKREGYLGDGPKLNSFVLLPKGQEFLLSQQPMAEQIAHLRHLHQQTMRSLGALTARIQQDLGSVSNQLQMAAAVAFDDTQQRLVSFAGRLDDLAMQGELAELATEVQRELGACRDAAIATIDAEAQRLQRCEQQLQSAIEEQHLQLSEYEKQLQSRIDRLSGSSRQNNGRSCTENDGLQGSGQEASSLEETIVERVEQCSPSNVPAPLTLSELLRDVKERHPNKTLGEFHEALRALYDARRVRLMPFTRALASIPDPRSALFMDGEVMYYVGPH
jgi:hypothetical protein